MILTSLVMLLSKKEIKITSYIIIQTIFMLICLSYVILDITVSKTNSISALKTVFLNYVINFSITNYIYFKYCSNKNLLFTYESIIKLLIPVSIFVSIFILIYCHGTGVDGRLANGILKPFSSSQAYLSTEIALVSLYGVSSCLYFFFKEKKKKYLLIMPLLILIIVLSGSRKTFLALLLLIFLFYYDFNQKKITLKSFFKLFFVLFIVISLLYSTIKIPILYKNIGWRFEGVITGEESSAYTRNIMYETAVKNIKRNPIFGYGLNTFSTFSGSFGAWAHNNYLEILVSGGILLFIFYYSLYVYLFINLYKIRNNHPMFKYFLYMIIIIIMCDFIGVTYMDRLVQLFLTLAALLINVYKKEMKGDANNAIKN